MKSCAGKLREFQRLIYSTYDTTNTFILSLISLRIALIQDSVQVRAAGLRALRYIVRCEEDFLAMNRLLFPYFIARYYVCSYCVQNDEITSNCVTF